MKKIIIILFLCFNNMILSSAMGDDSVEIASFLFIKRCINESPSICFESIDQFPNITIALVSTEQNDSYVVYKGSSVRTQDLYQRTFIQTTTVEKVIQKETNNISYTFSAQVSDDSGKEIIPTFRVFVNGDLNQLNKAIISGTRILREELNDFLIPQFYLGSKFVSDSEL